MFDEDDEENYSGDVHDRLHSKDYTPVSIFLER